LLYPAPVRMLRLCAPQRVSSAVVVAALCLISACGARKPLGARGWSGLQKTPPAPERLEAATIRNEDKTETPATRQMTGSPRADASRRRSPRSAKNAAATSGRTVVSVLTHEQSEDRATVPPPLPEDQRSTGRSALGTKKILSLLVAAGAVVAALLGIDLLRTFVARRRLRPRG